MAICDQITKSSKKGLFLIKSLVTKKIKTNLSKKILSLVKKITKTFSLKGINNLDLILQGEKIFLLEVNPRPGLSTNILNSIIKIFLKLKVLKRKLHTMAIIHQLLSMQEKKSK